MASQTGSLLVMRTDLCPLVVGAERASLRVFEEPKENRGLSGNPHALIVGKEPHWCRGELAGSPGHTDKGSTEEISLPLQGGFPGSVRKQVPPPPRVRLSCTAADT